MHRKERESKRAAERCSCFARRCLWELFCTVECRNRLLVAVHPEVTLKVKLDAENVPPLWRAQLGHALALRHRPHSRSRAALPARFVHARRLVSRPRRPVPQLKTHRDKINLRTATAFDEVVVRTIAAAVEAKAGGFDHVHKTIHDALRVRVTRLLCRCEGHEDTRGVALDSHTCSF